MKKALVILLTVVMVLALMPTLALAAGRTTIADPGTITVAADTTASYTDTDFIVNSAMPLFDLTGDNASLILNNCTITYTVGGTGISSAVCAKAIQVEAGISGIGVTLNDATINMPNQYSIGIVTVDTASSGNITLTNSKILFALTAGGTHSTYSRGIEASGLTINLNNSEISDCYYPIWVRGTTGGTTVNVAGSKLSGYCAINVRNSNNTINVTNGSQLIGTNYYSGGSDDFDVINFYVGAGAVNNTVTVTNSTMSAIQLGTAIQYIIAEESAGGANNIALGTGTTVYYSGNVKYVIAGEECNSSPFVIDAAANFLNNSSKVTAGVDPTYTIVIPSAVNFGTLVQGTGTRSQDFDVAAQNVLIETGASINVSVTSPFEMMDLNGAGIVPLAYTLASTSNNLGIDSGELFASFTESRVEDGDIEVNTASITQAGAYQGTMVFNIAYVD